MSSKTLYWKNRKAGKRGQGDTPSGKLYKKGEKVEYVDRKGKKKEYPNAVGQHLVRVAGRGLQYLSRKESRRRAVDRDYTRSNYDYITTKRTDQDGNPDHFPGHKPNPEKKKETGPKYPPKLTNHVRHRERQITRELERSKK